MYLEGQDWENKVLTGKKTNPKPIQTNVKHISKLDSDDPPPPPKPHSLTKRLDMIKLRTSKKITQKELAKGLNVQLSEITNFESGKIKISNNLYQRMKTYLDKKK